MVKNSEVDASTSLTKNSRDNMLSMSIYEKGFQSFTGLKAFFHITLFLQYLAQLPHSLACSTLQMCKLLSANP